MCVQCEVASTHARHKRQVAARPRSPQMPPIVTRGEASSGVTRSMVNSTQYTAVPTGGSLLKQRRKGMMMARYSSSGITHSRSQTMRNLRETGKREHNMSTTVQTGDAAVDAVTTRHVRKSKRRVAHNNRSKKRFGTWRAG